MRSDCAPSRARAEVDGRGELLRAIAADPETAACNWHVVVLDIARAWGQSGPSTATLPMHCAPRPTECDDRRLGSRDQTPSPRVFGERGNHLFHWG
jgi:hypothetical protein